MGKITHLSYKHFLRYFEKQVPLKKLKSDQAAVFRLWKKEFGSKPDHPEGLYSLGIFALFCGKPRLAVKCFDRLIQGPMNYEVKTYKKAWTKYLGPAINSLCSTLSKLDGEELAAKKFAEALIIFGYGRQLATKKSHPRTTFGESLPMYTLPAIEYLDQFDFSNKYFFEYGGGHSTIFWGKRAKKVISVETDKTWIDFIKTKTGSNVEFLEKEVSEAPKAIDDCRSKFDVIIVDGAFNRFESAKASLNMLKPGGIIILDNSDWYPNTTTLLRNSGFFQVDFIGLKPIQFHTSTTSIFVGKKFSFKTKAQRQPRFGIASLPLNAGRWDRSDK